MNHMTLNKKQSLDLVIFAVQLNNRCNLDKLTDAFTFLISLQSR